MQDRQSYERAVTGSLIGLGLQLLVGLTLLGLAIWLKHPAVVAAAWHAGGGLAIWTVLLVIFQQHRLERAEALEAEKLSQLAGADGRLFEQAEEDLSVARRRLRQLNRFGLPIVALFTSLYLLATGIGLLIGCAEHLQPDAPQVPVADPLFALILCVGVAFLGFVSSRYLSGMARQGVWQLLRSGASYLMGSVLAALLLGTAFALAHFESPTFLRILIPVIPSCMVLLGLETGLNLVLDIYRPRKKGEFARPAFDSRLLGLLTSPENLAITVREAINYQFGFEITRSWFWRLLGRALLPLAGMGLLAFVLLSCIVVVKSPQQALVLRMGSLAREAPLSSGLHFKLPWPLETAEFYEVSIVRELRLGLSRADEKRMQGLKDEHDHEHGGQEDHHDHEASASPSILWGSQHSHGAEPMWLVGGSESGGDRESDSGIAVSVLNAYVPVQWRIKERELVRFAQASVDPEQRLRLLAEQVLNRYLFGCDVDAILGPKRSEAGRQVRELLQQVVDEAGLGIEVVFVGMSGLHPTAEGEVAASFHDAIKADQERHIAITSAQQERTRILTETAGSVAQAEALLGAIRALDRMGTDDPARAQADESVFSLLQSAGGAVANTLANARSFRWTHENTERAKASRFAQEILPYRQAPNVYRMRRYLEVLSEGLVNARKYLVLGDREKLTIRLDLKDTDIGLLETDLGKETK